MPGARQLPPKPYSGMAPASDAKPAMALQPMSVMAFAQSLPSRALQNISQGSYLSVARLERNA